MSDTIFSEEKTSFVSNNMSFVKNNIMMGEPRLVVRSLIKEKLSSLLLLLLVFLSIYFHRVSMIDGHLEEEGYTARSVLSVFETVVIRLGPSTEMRVPEIFGLDWSG